MAAVRPIKPNEVAKMKEVVIPDVVFESFNHLIAQNYGNGSAVVKQHEVVSLLKEKGLVADEIYKNHWLDVEDVYRSAGWKVKYDKPAYCESFDAYFKFSKE
jgi:hypothetical protein